MQAHGNAILPVLRTKSIMSNKGYSLIILITLKIALSCTKDSKKSDVSASFLWHAFGLQHCSILCRSLKERSAADEKWFCQVTCLLMIIWRSNLKRQCVHKKQPAIITDGQCQKSIYLMKLMDASETCGKSENDLEKNFCFGYYKDCQCSMILCSNCINIRKYCKGCEICSKLLCNYDKDEGCIDGEWLFVVTARIFALMILTGKVVSMHCYHDKSAWETCTVEHFCFAETVDMIRMPISSCIQILTQHITMIKGDGSECNNEHWVKKICHLCLAIRHREDSSCEECQCSQGKICV